MSLLAIIISGVVIAGTGIGIYFLIKKKSVPVVINSDIPTSLQIIVGIIENQK